MWIWTRSLLLSITLAASVTLAGCDFFLSADQRVQRAESRIAAQDYRGAMIELKNALQAQQDHVRARLLLAQVSLQLGDAAAADKELRRAVEGGVPVSQIAPLAADVRLALGKPNELLSMIDAGELPLPPPQRALYRGKALLDLQQPDQALAAFSEAATQSPTNDAHLGIAEAYAALGRADEALRELDAIPANDPLATDALVVRGSIYARRGQFDEAERTLQAARPSAAKNLSLRQRAMLLAVLIETQLARGDVSAAHSSHADLAAISKDAPLTRLLSARIAMAEQNYSAAVNDLQRVAAAAPDFVAARFLLGAALLAQGNLHQAELHLTQALERAPENLEARKLLAQVQLRLERPDAAMQILLPASQSDAGDAQVDALLGLAHLQRGEDGKGIAFLEHSVAANPGNRNSKLDLAAAYLHAGANAKAVDLLRNLDHSAADTHREQLLIAAVAADGGQKAANAEIEKLLQRFAQDVGLLNLVGEYFARHNELERARGVLARAARIKPDDPPTLINSARIEIAAQRPDVAIGMLEKAISVDARNVPARMLLAELALRSNDSVTATQWLEQARQQNADAVEPRLQLARLHLRERRGKEADEVLKEVLAAASGRADVVNSVGLINLEAGRYEEALARFRAATDLAADSPIYWLNVARAQLALGHGSVAREALQKSTALRPNWVPAVSTLVLLDIREGKSAAAMERVTELKKALPADASAFVLEGDVHFALKRYAEAAVAFDRAAALQPSAMAALKSYRARQQGGLGDAALPLETWVKRQPEDFAARTVLADAYQLTGQSSRAIEQYEVIVRNGQPTAAVLNNLAWLYHEAGDARAEATAQRAYASAPNVPAVADTYGWILVQMGKAPAAVKVLQQASANAKDQPEIDYHYAAALAATGAAAEARKLLDTLLSRPAPFAARGEAERLRQKLSGP
jgi:cellulose synthase operon protein C